MGQRTLLDLLDTENELLSARRNAVNADSDLSLAYLRTYAGMGTLLEHLGLQKLDAADPGSQGTGTSRYRRTLPERNRRRARAGS